MTMPNDPIKARPPKLVAWALLVSVLLNLFLVGVFLGIVPQAKHKSFAPLALASAHGEYLTGWVTRYLDPKDADIFREAVKAQTEALKEAHSHVHQAINDLAGVYGQDPPDKAALQTALDRLARARAEVNEVVGTILQTAYTKLSPEGRRRLADLTQNPI